MLTRTTLSTSPYLYLGAVPAVPKPPREVEVLPRSGESLSFFEGGGEDGSAEGARADGEEGEVELVEVEAESAAAAAAALRSCGTGLRDGTTGSALRLH